MITHEIGVHKLVDQEMSPAEQALEKANDPNPFIVSNENKVYSIYKS